MDTIQYSHPALEIINVSKHYSGHTALNDVSITVPESSIFGLLGPNGAGKTSLIRIINQITGPDSGEVRFDKQHLSPSHLSQIGYLPEERGLYKKMEVGEQAMYLARLKGLSRRDAGKRLYKWFEKFDLMSWWNKKVEELSKGMQQKIQFITTVVHEPKLLILDEPFTGFDPINAELITDELMKMKSNGTTIMLSTHRMESVEAMCTHISLINRGKKILEGTVKEIKQSYKKHVYEIEYDGSPIAFANSLWTSFELVEHKQTDGHHKAVIKMNVPSNTNHLLQELLTHVKIISFRELLPAMNEIFIAMVRDEEIISEPFRNN